MSEHGVALTALVLEARRRGLSYGQLAALTNRSEQEKIIRAYERKRPNRKRRQKGEDL